jgi:ABC-type transport system involved in cytochrome c biogenesis permease subunit
MKKYLAWLIPLLAFASLTPGLRTPRENSIFDVNEFARLPVLNGGRVKPMDSLARNSLLLMSGRQSLRVDGRRISAASWMLDVLFRPSAADATPSFLIDDPEVLGLLGIEQTRRRRFAFQDLKAHLSDIAHQAEHAAGLPAERRSRFQSAVLNLQSRLTLYQRLQNTMGLSETEDARAELHVYQSLMARAARSLSSGKGVVDRETEGYLKNFVARYRFLDANAEFRLFMETDASGAEVWRTVGQALLDLPKKGEVPGALSAALTLGDAYRRGDAPRFHEALRDLHRIVREASPKAVDRASQELTFNRLSPFLRSLSLYLAVFLLVFGSWLAAPGEGALMLNRAAYRVLWLAFALHTGGLVARMVLQGRPPVTNLYSSAIFVGFVAALLGLALERLHRNGIGAMVASGIGSLSLIVAHHLSGQGDTMEMMRAVLDSNFWLATHVITITIGYGSTFLSGFLAILYILRGVFTRTLTDSEGRSLTKMVYGVVCFSTFFSFIGTVLGGIWADQSWGRFWGWDPKENGALLIVLWNALILHARWGGYIRSRGLMILSVFGNVITAFSWFGVNMLGIGLHSYGFMDKAFWWLMLFTATQLAVMAVGALPPQRWRSRLI